MKCEVCGCSVSINWGNDSVVVCEEHTNHIAELTSLNKSSAKEWKEGPQKFMPEEVDPSIPNMLPIWWAVTWRFLLMQSVLGGFLWLELNHVMNTLIMQSGLDKGIAEFIGTAFYLLMGAVFIFVTLDRVIGKNLGKVRLVIVRAKGSVVEEQ